MANAVNYLSQIQTGQTIQAVHVNQFVEALSGSAAYDLVTSGSYTIIGPLYATASWASNAVAASTASWALNAITSSYALSALSSSYALSSSFALASISSSYSVSSSYAAVALSSSYALSSSKAVESGITTQVRPSNIASNFGYNIPYLSGTGSTATLYYSAIGPKYNPSTSTLTDDYNNLSLVGTASWASNGVTASIVQNYVPGTANYTTIYPQGTIYTKFEDVYMSQSATPEFDLLAATLTFTGTRDLPTTYVQANTSGEAKIVKFNIKGYIGNTGGLGTPDIESYVKIGTTTLNSTKLGAVTLDGGADQTPFELEYELVFSNNSVNTCGGIAYCKNGDYKKYPLSNLYQSDPAPAIGGAIQFIVSGSSALDITGSLAYIEFIN